MPRLIDHLSPERLAELTGYVILNDSLDEGILVHDYAWDVYGFTLDYGHHHYRAGLSGDQDAIEVPHTFWGTYVGGPWERIIHERFLASHGGSTLVIEDAVGGRGLAVPLLEEVPDDLLSDFLAILSGDFDVSDDIYHLFLRLIHEAMDAYLLADVRRSLECIAGPESWEQVEAIPDESLRDAVLGELFLDEEVYPDFDGADSIYVHGYDILIERVRRRFIEGEDED